MDVNEDKKRSQWLDDLTWEQQTDPDWRISEDMFYMSKRRRTATATALNKVPYITTVALNGASSNEATTANAGSQ